MLSERLVARSLLAGEPHIPGRLSPSGPASEGLLTGLARIRRQAKSQVASGRVEKLQRNGAVVLPHNDILSLALLGPRERAALEAARSVKGAKWRKLVVESEEKMQERLEDLCEAVASARGAGKPAVQFVVRKPDSCGVWRVEFRRARG